MRIIFFILFWFLYFPLLRLISLLMFWNSKLETRERFEKRNKFEYLAQSFKDKGMKADYCFQFSSEGEFQQVAPLVDDALHAGKIVELVFFSPSVEKGVMALAQKWPAQVRYLRYPLVRLFPFVERRSFTHWVTAKTLIMVRYDLFPEFLLWSMKKGHSLRFVWFTFKKERVRGKNISFWKKLFLKRAEVITYATIQDLELGKTLGLPGTSYDFRIEQIRRRVENRDEKFRTNFALYPEFKKWIETTPREKRFILGNAWPSDLFLLKDLPEDALLVVVPHQLSPEIISLFKEGLDNLGRELFEITDATRDFKNSKTILVNKKGILCELYTDFGFAYVGGGFEGSIHSVLEPLVAGSDQISVGPFHDRSTEYDVAEALGKMTEVNTPEQFLAWPNLEHKTSSDDKMKEIYQNYEEARGKVLSC